MSENSSRLAHYKNHAKNQDQLRLRRHEVSVELRKNKRDDQLLKRRNIADEEINTSPLKEYNGQAPQSPVQMSMEEIMQGLNSSDYTMQFNATQAARKMLSREKKPPIDEMIGHGVVPICVRFLERFDK